MKKGETIRKVGDKALIMSGIANYEVIDREGVTVRGNWTHAREVREKAVLRLIKVRR